MIGDPVEYSHRIKNRSETQKHFLIHLSEIEMDEGMVASYALMVIFAGTALWWGFLFWLGYSLIRLFFNWLKSAENHYN